MCYPSVVNILQFPGSTPGEGHRSVPPMPAVPPQAAFPVYRELRQRGLDHWKACKALATLVHKHPDRFPEWAYDDRNHPYPPTVINQTVLDYAGEYSWDRQTKRLKPSSPFKEDIAQTRLREARKSYETTVNFFEEFSQRPPRDDDDRKMFISLREAKDIAWREYQEADALARRVLLEQPNPERVRAIYAQLIDKYEGLGPQYEMMCQSLAEQREWLERQQQSGRDIDPKIILELSKSMRDWIKQIQQYTESTKSESVSKEAQELVRAAVKILEDVIAPQAPKLWSDGIKELRRRLTPGVTRTA